MVVTVRKGFCSKVKSRQTYIGRSCKFYCTASLPAEEIAHGPKFKPREFHRIANDQLPTNPLMILTMKRYGDIFKVRNPIGNFSDELVVSHHGACCIDFKDSEIDHGGE